MSIQIYSAGSEEKEVSMSNANAMMVLGILGLKSDSGTMDAADLISRIDSCSAYLSCSESTRNYITGRLSELRALAMEYPDVPIHWA